MYRAGRENKTASKRKVWRSRLSTDLKEKKRPSKRRVRMFRLCTGLKEKTREHRIVELGAPDIVQAWKRNKGHQSVQLGS